MMAITHSKDLSLKIINLLIDKGANLNIRDNNNRTALMLAVNISVNDNKFEIVELLIKKSNNMDIKYCQELNFAITSSNKNPKISSTIINYIVYLEHHRLCMKKLVSELKKKFNAIALKPNSFSIKLYNIKWQLNNGANYGDLSGHDKNFLLVYFNITNNFHLELKLKDYLNRF
jgi:ankyrin repeat protein